MGMIIHRHLRGTLGGSKPEPKEKKEVKVEATKDEPVEETKRRGRSAKRG